MTPTPSREHPLVLFDGACALCNATVRWIIARDRRAVFRFAALHSAAANAALAAARTPADLPDTLMFLDGDRLLMRSDAVIAVARRLGFPWSLAAAALILPRALRDGVYQWIARNRYRWFGRQNDACMAPTPEHRARFLDANEP